MVGYRDAIERLQRGYREDIERIQRGYRDDIEMLQRVTARGKRVLQMGRQRILAMLNWCHRAFVGVSWPLKAQTCDDRAI